jgi:dihydrofolate reductase
MPGAVAYIAASLDGFIATPDGSVGWLDGFQGEEYGFDAFLAGVETLAMGRATYDQVRGLGAWPYGARRCHVVTSRPLDRDAPAGVEAWAAEDLPELAARLAASDPPAWVVGGGRLIGAMLAARAIAELDLFVMPVLLGAGVPLFAGARPVATLALVETRAWPNGAVRLRYRLSG